MRTEVLYLAQADKPLPCPPEEIVKQNVIPAEVTGGSDIIPEMIVVTILMVCHLLVVD